MCDVRVLPLFFGVVGALLGYNYEKREALDVTRHAHGSERSSATQILGELRMTRLYLTHLQDGRQSWDIA